jgi:polyhydroxybutyrate depolymerase
MWRPRDAAVVRRLLQFALCALTLLGTAAFAAQTEVISIAGRQRTFTIDQPSSGGPHPTIFMLHGAGGTVRELRDLPGAARQAGAVTVVPSGIGGRWNFFPPGHESDSDRAFFDRLGGLPDDEAFLSALAHELVARGIADPRRIFIAGLSLGGVMALRMACADASLFAGMAVLIAGMEQETGAACQPAKPLRILMVRGTDDPVIPDTGGLTVRGDRVWPTNKLTDFFRQLNGCSAPPAHSVVAQTPLRIEAELSKDCHDNPVVLYRIIGGGHEVPAQLNIDALVLDFFELRTPGPLPPVTVGPSQTQDKPPATLVPLSPVTVGPPAR